MSYNGSGTFVINTAGQPVVSGTVISSTAFNALTADLATGLSTAITKDGQTTPTANIPMGNNKITGLAVGTAATDAANLSQVQSTAAKLVGSVSGVDTITGTMSPTLAAYAAGQMFYFVAAGDNTGAVTLNLDGLGAKAVTRDGSVALAAGDIKSGEVVVVVYDGTRFQVVSQLNSAGNATFANVSITSALNVGGVATFSGGTANGVLYLNGSKVATSGSALTFDGNGAVISVNSSSDALRITQVGAGNALLVEDSANPDATPTVITAAGDLGIGTTSPQTLLHIAANNSSSTSDTPGATIRLEDTDASVAAGQPIGKIEFYANDGTTPTVGVASYILAKSAATNGGANLMFATAAAGSASASERMRITSAGNVGIGTTAPVNVLDLGSGTNGRGIAWGGSSGTANYNNIWASQGGARLTLATMLRGSTSVTNGYESSNAGNFAKSALEIDYGVIKFFTDAASAVPTGNAYTPTERMRITAAGELLVGGTTSIDPEPGRMTLENPFGGFIYLFRNDTSISTNNVLGGLSFMGSDTTGNTPRQHAYIYGIASGTHAAGDNPTDLVFGTTADGSETAAEKMRLDQAGNLGLGVVPSAWGTQPAIQQLGGALWGVNAANYEILQNAFYNGTNYIYRNTNLASRYNQNAGVHSWFTAPSGTAGNAITFTQAMTLDASGNLLVGQTSTTRGAANRGVIEVNGSSNSIIALNRGGAAGGYIFSTSGEMRVAQGENSPLTFFTNDTERARITSGGDLLVGTTTYQNKRVTIDGGSSGGVWASCSSSANAVNVTYNSATSGDNVFEEFYTDGGPNLRGSITYNRGSGQVAYNITSDVRLKENITDAADAGVKIDSLQVRQFDWKESGNHVDYGFVAQELHTVAPQAVTKPEDEESMWSVDYSKLVPMLVKEIQSLRARVAQLEAK